MRIIDIVCESCGAQTIDYFQRNSEDALPRCEAEVVREFEVAGGTTENGEPQRISRRVACGGIQTRLYLPSSLGTVIDDSIPGGMLMYNGLCHKDGTPRRFYSKTEIRKAAEKAGMTNVVQHQPGKGTDKSKHTTRWV